MFGETVRLSAAEAAATTQAQPRNLVGLTRGDAIRVLGKPQSTLKRGEREILMFASGARVEIVDDLVVSYRADENAMILTRGNTQYIGSADGYVERVGDEAEVPVAAEPVVVAEAPPPTPEPPAVVEEPPPVVEPEPTIEQPPAAPETPAPAPSEDLDPEALAAPVGGLGLDLAEKIPGSKTTAEEYLNSGKITLEEKPPPPPKLVAVAAIVEMVLRLVFVVAIVTIALKWLSLPFYFPDLIKAGVFYVVIRQGLHGLGGLGGMWEMLRFFRVADVVGFFALAVALFRFKVVQTGLTALKVAAVASLVSYFIGILFSLLAAMVVFGTQ